MGVWEMTMSDLDGILGFVVGVRGGSLLTAHSIAVEDLGPAIRRSISTR